MIDANSFLNQIGVVLLSGGASIRMGTPKALLTFPNGSLLVDSIIDCYQSYGVQNISVVVQPQVLSQWNFLSLRTDWNFFVSTVNETGNESRFCSIQKGISNLSKCQSVFIHNIDNPFVNKEILFSLLNKIDSNRFVIPSFNSKGGHPILIGRDIIDFILQQKDPNQNFRELLKRFCRFEVEVPFSQILANINTPIDWKQWINDNF